MRRGPDQIQQFCWISSTTAKGFIDLLNEAGREGFELRTTYQVQDKFMRALMERWQDPPEFEDEVVPVANILRLVPKEGEDAEDADEADVADECDQQE